jgi:hypothetical protein
MEIMNRVIVDGPRLCSNGITVETQLEAVSAEKEEEL